ncbi:MAG: primosomal protein N', partial [Chloroflexi bacterium]|nr:primosomal protein N' [Chloroflexota bacterium]
AATGTGIGGQSPATLAAVNVIDLRRELKEGNHTIFSRALDKAMNETLDDGKQAILFLNRRGASTFVQCRDCGAVVSCRNCDVSLTFHLAGDLLLCHQCNAVGRVPKMCAQCGSARIKFLGLGTQRVEEEVRRRWPDARVLRWDRDSVRTRQQHEEVLRLFQEHQADILIGTQMVAKGLDLPRVTLVGVVNADVNLFLPDFRAAERTFQLLTQVAGRAGRGPWAGRVIIQTYSPDHYAVAAAARQDYAAFFARERVFRRQHGYPPYGRMVRLLFSHPGEARAKTEAEALGARLREVARIAGIANVNIMGPTPAYPSKARGRYRWQIILLGAAPHALLDKATPPRGWQVDVDPMGL